MTESIPAAAWGMVAAVVGALVGWLSTRVKTKADAASVQSETSIDWIRELRTEIERLQTKIGVIEAALTDSKARYRLLDTRYERLDDRYDRLAERYDRLVKSYDELTLYLKNLGLSPDQDRDRPLPPVESPPHGDPV